jgi:hypothetical protein
MRRSALAHGKWTKENTFPELHAAGISPKNLQFCFSTPLYGLDFFSSSEKLGKTPAATFGKKSGRPPIPALFLGFFGRCRGNGRPHGTP